MVGVRLFLTGDLAGLSWGVLDGVVEPGIDKKN